MIPAGQNPWDLFLGEADMAARKPGVPETSVKTAAGGDVPPPQTPAPTAPQNRATGDGFPAAVALSAVGMGLAMQSATHAGETALQAPLPDSREPAVAEPAAALPEAAPEGIALAEVPAAEVAPAEDAPVTIAAVMPAETAGAPEAVLAFAPPLGRDDLTGAGDVPIRIATNTTLPLTAAPVTGPAAPVLPADPSHGGLLAPLPGGGVVAPILEPVLGDGGIVDSLLDPLLGDGGLVDNLLDPILGDGGLVDSLLDPILGDGGVVDNLLDPLLGEDGLIGGLLETVTGGLLDPVLGQDGLLGGITGAVTDPLLGEDGLVGGLLDPVTGTDGIVSGVLDPLLGQGGVVTDLVETLTDGALAPVLGEDGVLGSVLDPLLGEGGALSGALDPLLGEDGVVETVLDPLLGEGSAVGNLVAPILGEDGALGGVLAPVVGEGGLVDTLLGPVLDNLGPVGGLVNGLLGGIFGASDAAAVAEPAAADDGFVESLLGAATIASGAESYGDLADVLSVGTDPVLDGLLSDDPLSDLDIFGVLPTDDGLLADMAGLGLTGALGGDALLDPAAPGLEALPDPDVDSLLNEILDSGERAVAGVSDPLSALLDLTPDVADTGAMFGDGLESAVDGALNTLLSDLPSEVDLLAGTLGEGGLLGGLGLLNRGDETD